MENWSIETIVLKFQKVLLGPSLQYSITPIINNVLWTTDDPIDKETQFKAVHSIHDFLCAAADSRDPDAFTNAGTYILPPCPATGKQRMICLLLTVELRSESQGHSPFIKTGKEPG